MSITGRCNCESVGVELSISEKDLLSVACHCTSCLKAGGGYSVNYIVDEAAVTVHDPTGVLRIYMDNKTGSGNPMPRRFCSTCGSPIMSQSQSLKEAGKFIVKATLFENQVAPSLELFTASRNGWQHPIEGAAQK